MQAAVAMSGSAPSLAGGDAEPGEGEWTPRVGVPQPQARYHGLVPLRVELTAEAPKTAAATHSVHTNHIKRHMQQACTYWVYCGVLSTALPLMRLHMSVACRGLRSLQARDADAPAVDPSAGSAQSHCDDVTETDTATSRAPHAPVLRFGLQCWWRRGNGRAG